MRFHLGPIPDEFRPDGSWRSIREPSPFVLQLFAVPIGIGASWLVAYCWQRIGLPSAVFRAGEAALLFAALLLSFPVIIMLHELLHAVVHPQFGRSPSTIIGAWPRQMLFYAHYSGPLTRNRFLLVFAMPFLILTIVPLVAGAIGLLPPSLALAAAWCSTWNALFACGDYVGFALIWAQVPRAVIVQNQSWRTFWKPV